MQLLVRFGGALFLIIATCLVGYAQPATVTGKVVDQDGNPMAYATVALHTASDSALVAGAITDDQGQFLTQSPPGPHLVQIKMLSYRESWFKVELKKGKNDLGEFALVPAAVDLEEVEIRAERSQMVMKLDKRVFNVGSDLNNTARNASELLDNVPSVAVDMDGNVSLRGSENVRILIDGKPSGLVGTGSTDALRQLPGNLVDKIEVITNPSARYEAEGEVGILNIVLKKEKRSGINGAFELTGGVPHNHRASYSLNLRKKSFNLFSNFALTYRSTPGQGSADQRFDLGDTTFSYLTTRKRVRGGWGQALTLGSDFFLSPKDQLTVSGLVRRSVGNNRAELSYQDFNFENVNTANDFRLDEEVETKRVIEGALNYTRTFAQKGRKLTFDFQFIDSDDREASDISQTSDVIGVAPLYQRSDNVEDEQTWFFQTNYVHPLGGEEATGKFEAGYRGNLRFIENDFVVEELNEADGTWSPLADFDNEFLYTENIQAAYLQASNQTGRWSYQGGLRAEYTDLSTELLKTNETNPRTFFNLFPSAFLSYEAKAGRTWQLSYSRRISRPRFRNLLPFTSYSDNRNFRAGNPNLNPEFTNSLEAGYVRDFEKGSLLSSLYYRHRTGVIQRIVFADSTGFIFRIPVNLAVQHAYGVEFNLGLEPTDWWNLNGNFNFYRAITRGDYEGQNFDADTYTWNARLSSKMKFPRLFDAQVTFDYRAPEIRPQGRMLAIYFMDIGLSRDILKRKGTLTFSVRDLFNSRRWRWTVEEEDYFLESAFQWRQRQFQLSFNYRLNQEKKRGGRRGGRSGGSNGGSGGGGGDF